MARKIAAVVFSLGCVHASSLMALGLGELTLDSFLNEPLKASVDLLNTGTLHEDQVRIRLATSEDFKRMGIDRAYFLTSISFEVDMDDKGNSRIVLTSQDPVLEPYLDFIIEARWPSGRLLREYTVLVDPPVFDQGAQVISASQRVSQVEGSPEPAKKKQVETQGSGTHVKIGESDLSSGDMPRRDFNATTSQSPVPGSRYMIHRDDTLWQIAVSAKPGGASVHQTMLDIQRLNPDAFIDGNINRIKAGYIVYLPSEGDISSENLSAALTEVREQNEAWRESKATEPDYGSGPSLRISTESDDTADVVDENTAVHREVASSVGSMEDMEKSELERAEMAQRLQAMEQQVETLQRIVSLKDDQIAALQTAVGGGGQVDQQAQESADAMIGEEITEAVDGGLESVDSPASEAEAQFAQDVEAVGGESSEAATENYTEDAADVAEAAVAPAEPEVQEPEQETVAPTAPQSGGIMSYLWYILGAAVLAIIGFVMMRRRGGEDDGESLDTETAPAVDVFADVELRDQPLEVETEEVALEPEVDLADLLADEALEDEPEKSARGYGQRKHDEYAIDAEANDALAEADIYIAYGRHPQAIDLLKNAIANEPGNPEYRLKLLEVYIDTGEQSGVIEQMAGLETLDDAGSILRARELLEASGDTGGLEGTVDHSLADELDAVIPDLLVETDESLEADFTGLEIEKPGGDDDIEAELDLSADFDASDLAPESLDEELVIAAESNGMSTKLDLARAYLDMGDDDGARQILEEVAAEASEELQVEARELLERIG